MTRLLQNEKLLNMSTRMIVKRAREKNIPVIILNAAHNFIQLGVGCRGQKIKSTRFPLSNPGSIELADNKYVTNQLLKLAGLPNPPGEAVQTFPAAARVARKIGWPVVVKPGSDTAHGHGVQVKVENLGQLRTALTKAKKFGPKVIIEQYLAGEEYRFIIINYRVVAVTKRVPAHVIGDGRRTIQQLVQRVNQDPRRGGMFGSILTKIKITSEAKQLLRRQGYALQSIPVHGKKILLTLKSNIGLGGLPVDTTDDISPALKTLALQAAYVIGLPIAGVDLITCDPRGSKGTIIEVNGVPGIYPQLFPVEGRARDTTGALIRCIFSRSLQAFIPIYQKGKKITSASGLVRYYDTIPQQVTFTLNGRRYHDTKPRQTLLGYLINSTVTGIKL